MKHRFLKFAALAAVSITLFSAILPLTAHANADWYPDSGQVGDFCYYLPGDGTAIISRYVGTDEDVVIPNKVDGYPVTMIGMCAFIRNPDIVWVRIPEDVTVIDDAAFNICPNLEFVGFTSNNIEVRESVFYKCEKLEEVAGYEHIQSYGRSCFKNTPWLRHMQEQYPDFPGEGTVDPAWFSRFSVKEGTARLQTLDSIDPNTEALADLTLPATLEWLSPNDLQSCKNLKKVTFLGMDTGISLLAFQNCPDVTICGYDGSTAEAYAKKYNMHFESLGKAQLTSSVFSKGTVAIVGIGGFVFGILAGTAAVLLPALKRKKNDAPEDLNDPEN